MRWWENIVRLWTEEFFFIPRYIGGFFYSYIALLIPYRLANEVLRGVYWE